MKGISIIIGLILIGLLACSSGDKKKKEDDSLSADVEKSMGTTEGEEIFAELDMVEEKEGPGVTEMVEEEEVVIFDGPKREIVSKVTISELGDYRIKRGDTLLYISFKIYITFKIYIIYKRW